MVLRSDERAVLLPSIIQMEMAATLETTLATSAVPTLASFNALIAFCQVFEDSVLSWRRFSITTSVKHKSQAAFASLNDSLARILTLAVALTGQESDPTLTVVAHSMRIECRLSPAVRKFSHAKI